jgi:hypothetical protein
VGSYTITPGGLTSNNYAITFVSGTLAVTTAPLVVKANDATKVYGQANPAFTVSYTGFVNGDTASSLGGTLSFSTSATAASPVGSYTITPGGLTSNNYAMTLANGTLTITPAPLTVTANDATKVFGQPNPTFTASYSGFVNGDTAASLGGTLVFSTPATTTSPVGTYTITPSGLTSTNYTISFVSGTLTITAAVLVPDHLLLSAMPATVMAGSGFNISVNVVDAQGLVVSDYRGTIHFSTSDPSPGMLPSDYTFTANDSGVHTFSVVLGTAGTQTVTATDTVNSNISGSTTVTVTSPVTMIADGTILVCSYPFDSSVGTPTGIIGVDPNPNTNTFPIATSGNFMRPVTIREATDNQLYIADSPSTGTGAVIKVDPSTLMQTVFATGGNMINEPVGLAIDNADNLLFVLNAGTGVPMVVEIDLKTGVASPLSLMQNGNPLNLATPVALAFNNGVLYLADEGDPETSGSIYTYNLQTGVVTTLAQGNLLDHMVDLGFDGNGQLLAFIGGNGGSVIKVDAQGTQTPLVTGLFSTDPSLDGLVLDAGTVDIKHGGRIYVSSYDPSGFVRSRVLGIDPNTMTVVSTLAGDGLNLSVATGLTVFSMSGGGAAAAHSPLGGRGLHAGVSALLGLSQEDRTDLAAARTSLTSPSVTVAPQNPGVLPPLAAVPSAATVSKAATDSVFKDWDGSLVQEALSADLTTQP